jgi:bis(5'-nucleosidyl)-tetraphosphatase
MPSEPTNEIIRAAGFLLMMRRDNEFLLMRHPDRWDLPKGHCEEGESFLETALRETEEETGIPAAEISVDSEFIFELTYPVTYKRWGNRTLEKQVRYFLGYLDSKPRLQLTEHQSAEWFPWQPPHTIQQQTIDPLLAAVADHIRINTARRRS